MLWFLGVVLLGVALDLGSKAWIFATLGMPGEKPPIWFWEGVFGLRTSLNEGALFGLGQGQGGIFIAMSLFAIAGIGYWLFCLGAIHERWLTLSLGCITAGILGNLYDRLGCPGLIWNFSSSLHQAGQPVYAVRDWLDFALIDWPIFNLADSFLVCGAGLLLLHAYLFNEPSQQEATEKGA